MTDPIPGATPPSSAPPPARPPARPRGGAGRWLAGLLAVAALLVLAALAAVVLAVGSTTGSRWLLGLVPGLQAEGVSGCLAGDFAARSITLPMGDAQTLRLSGLAWQDLSVSWGDGQPPVVRLARLAVEEIDLRGRSADDRPPVLPASLRLPLSVHLAEVRVGRLRLDAIRERPVRDLAASVSLQAGERATHRIDALALTWDRLQAHGRLQLGADAPLPLQAALAVLPAQAPADGPALLPIEQGWRLDLGARGPLRELKLQARLAARGQALDARAGLRIEQRQPLSHVGARLHALDLAPLAEGLPTTALTGEIDATLDTGRADGSAAARQVQVRADLRNQRPGPVSARQVPVELVRIAASGDLRQPDAGRIDTLRLDLHDGAAPAGTVLGSGHWTFAGEGPARRLDLALTSTLQDLRPARLDARAPALELSGPLTLTWSQPAGDAPPGTAALPRRATLHTDLRGRLTGAGLPDVRLLVQAQATPDRLDLEQLQARSGAARLEASGRVAREDRHWRVGLRGQWEAFDPSVWWPGEPQGAWRRGPHRLDGRLDTDLRVPDTPDGDGMARLAAIGGRVEMQLAPSVLAGVPVAGTLRLDQPARTGPPGRLALDLQARLGDEAGRPETTELALTGEVRPGSAPSDGADDRWQLRWRSPAVERLAPLLQLAGLAGTRLAGATDGEAEVQGRWPHLRTRGRAAVPRLEIAGGAAARDATLAWQAGTRADDPLELDAAVGRLTLADGRDVSALQLQGRGRPDGHRLTLRAEAQDAPSEGAAAAAPRRARLEAALEGALDTAGPPRWRGTLRQLDLRDARAAAGAPPWLHAEALPLALAAGADGGGVSVQVGAGTLALDEARVSLDEARWQAGGALALRARLEPLRAAALLARAQPEFGWSGDLTLGGHVEVRATPDRFDADLLLQRVAGDLSVDDAELGTGPRRLGLADLRLALSAREGVWRLTQRVSGGNLGTLDGEQTVRAARQAMWPGADAPVTGQVDLQIAQLGHWGRWLPPGWRVTGRLATEARLGGRFGAPSVRGALTGSQIAVRHVLQGVDWHDAELQVALDGDTARIETLRVRAGAGTLEARGQARLGAAPELSMRVTADRFAVLQRVDRRVVASGEADLRLDGRATRLTGRVRADEGRFDFSQGEAPGLADDVDVDRGRGEARVREAAGSGRTVALDLRADLGDRFVLRGRGLQTRLAGELRLTSPASRLAVHGTIRAEDGTYAAYGQKLRIERSVIAFTGLPENPRLDIEAVRPDLEDVRVGVTVTGTAQNPRIRLFSEPAMSDTDRLSWLILGRASDGLGRTDLALLQRAAYALIAGESDSPGLVERIGLDQLSVRQDGEGDTRETVVTLGKQLSRRWYLGYERSLNAASGTWQLIYRAAQRFTLRAQSGAENALDLIWTWKWGSPPAPARDATMPGSAAGVPASSP